MGTSHVPLKVKLIPLFKTHPTLQLDHFQTLLLAIGLYLYQSLEFVVDSCLELEYVCDLMLDTTEVGYLIRYPGTLACYINKQVVGNVARS